MADRLQQYNMIPSFNPALMQQQQQQHHLNQQQQQQQQPQQSPPVPQQQDFHAAIPNFSDPTRMWQQIQQLNQLRPGDMNNAQNAQMMDLIRNQGLARSQSQQPQPPFNLGASQIPGGPSAAASQAQSQSFLESTSPQHQPHMSPAFSSLNAAGMSGSASLQHPLGPRGNGMLSGFPGQGPLPNAPPNLNISRQIEMMNLAQNQQPQNAPMNMAARIEQHRQQQQQHQHQQLQPVIQGTTGELFPSPAMAPADRRPSPAQPMIQQSNSGNPQQPSQHRRPALAELTEQINTLKSQTHSIDQSVASLKSQRTTMSEEVFKAKVGHLLSESKKKKDLMAELLTVVSQLYGHNFSLGGVTMGLPGTGGAQSAWIPSGGPQPFDAGGQIMRSQLQGQAHAQSGVQSSPSHLRAQLQQTNQFLAPSVISTPRSGPTQLQNYPSTIGGGRFANQMSPNMAPQYPFSVNNNPGGSVSSSPALAPSVAQPGSVSNLPPPLEKNKFDATYKSWIMQRNIKLDGNLMSVDGQPIDLHMLHTHVMIEGGFAAVNAKESWNVIGGKMGFVQFPGSPSEPAKCGPGVAQRLAQVYKEYLFPFDDLYIGSVNDSRKRMMGALVSGAGNASQPRPQPFLPHNLDPQQVQSIVNYANYSVEELRKKGVQEGIIQFVESNRANLQRTVMEQEMFRRQFQTQANRAVAEHNNANGSAPFSGSVTASVLAQRQLMQSQQSGAMPMPPANSFMANRPRASPHPSQSANNVLQFHPTKEQLHHASANIAKMKAIHNQRGEYFVMHSRAHDLPPGQRPEYNTLFDQLHRLVNEVEKFLPMYSLLPKIDEQLMKITGIIVAVNHQRQLLSSPSPRFLLSLEALRTMKQQVQQFQDVSATLLQALIRQPQPHHQTTATNTSHPAPSDLSRPLPLPQLVPPAHQLSQLTAASSQPQLLSQSLQPPNRQSINIRPSPVAKKPSVPPAQAVIPPSAATPTSPPAHASTPGNAPTPTQTASSPQAPKSPKSKPPAKQRPPAKRRASVKNPPSLSSEPQTAPSGASNGGQKRPREEEQASVIANTESPAGTSFVANEPSPPKRAKIDWIGPPSEAVKKKAEAVENVKTEEDASALFEQMTELIKMAGGEGQEALTSDISETLDMILKGYGAVPDGSEASDNISLLGLGETSSNAQEPQKPSADEFVEFFDFSSFGTLEEQDDSKAPTPDLLLSSSTNHSPESGSESEAVHHTVLSSTESKSDDLMDSLRLGTWKEIDNGESAYYQSTEWKYDSPMPTQDPAWVFTS